jgi:hypothetical protein
VSLLAQDDRLTRRVGAITLGLLASAIVFFVFIYDQIEWGSHTRVVVYFRHSGGLHEGSTFVVAGRVVGRVESVALIPRGAKAILGNDEGVALTVAIDRDMADQLTLGGDVFVASRGPLSEKYLELAPPLEPGAPLAEHAELLGHDPPSLDRVLQRTWDNLTTARKFAEEVRPEANAVREQIDALRANLAQLAPAVALRADVDALVAEARTTWNGALGGRAGVDRIEAVIAEGRATLAQGRAMLDALEPRATALRASLTGAQGTIGKKGTELIDKIELAISRVRASIDRLDPLLAQVEALNARIARGEGSLLKLMNDPEFPEDAKELGKILKRQPWKVVGHPQE